MNESPTNDPQTTPMLGGTAAFRLGVALLIGVALMLALTMLDRQRRGKIEGWEEVTAVGDRSFFPPPSSSAAPAVVTWEAGSLTVTAGEPQKMKDTQMRRAGRDEASGMAIYEHTTPTPGAARYFLKVAPGEYLPAK